MSAGMSQAGQPLVSVLVPFFNARMTLLQAVQSVFAQSWGNWELVLLDDGSRDGSLELAQSIADPRVRVFSDGVNQGHANRRNELTSLARGEFLALLDADDLMHPQRIEKQMALLAMNPALDVVATAVASMAPDCRIVGVRDMAALDMSALRVLAQGGLAHPSLLGRRQWFMRHPYRSGYRIGEDRELLLRALPDTRFGKVCEPLYFYREAGTLSRGKLLEGYRIERRLIREYGPGYVGRKATLLLLLRSKIKSLVVWTLARLGRLELLSRRRQGAAPEAGVLPSLQADVAGILATPLPRGKVMPAA